ncbi:SRPBCC family protein [Boseongicola aestuarii]|uniref:Activator of Hsp90 ATPase homologue 1/2-like C-terminal domain-containing protein n=1 Tax=Boseongicola aestuarii TaxID=1470561 RepID=A0A238J0B4_9RHOB|nr:SRPBCC domain-containing protein [Boseongicola aestuarii]SMX24159.1 hypothetical protein BOA8489_02282 [Boseongicola aestuarii]
MTDQATELTLEVSRLIPAVREKLFDAWLDPAMLAQFMMPAPNMSVPEATSDARAGGRFLIVMRVGDKDMPHAGTYKTIDRANQIVFTWESPMSPVENSIVTLDFKDAEGGTDVRLTHVRFPSEESRANHEGGWTRILATLAETLGS